MKLLPDEYKIEEIGSLTLTTFRVRKTGGYTSNRRRAREVASIRLEHITHCQITSSDQPALIVVGALIIIAGIAIDAKFRAPIAVIMGLILGTLLIVSFFTGRDSEIEVASPTITLWQRVKRKSLDDAMMFIHDLERAAIERSDKRPEPERVIIEKVVQGLPEESENGKVVLKSFVSERQSGEAEYWGG